MALFLPLLAFVPQAAIAGGAWDITPVNTEVKLASADIPSSAISHSGFAATSALSGGAAIEGTALNLVDGSLSCTKRVTLWTYDGSKKPTSFTASVSSTNNTLIISTTSSVKVSVSNFSISQSGGTYTGSADITFDFSNTTRSGIHALSGGTPNILSTVAFNN